MKSVEGCGAGGLKGGGDVEVVVEGVGAYEREADRLVEFEHPTEVGIGGTYHDGGVVLGLVDDNLVAICACEKGLRGVVVPAPFAAGGCFASLHDGKEVHVVGQVFERLPGGGHLSGGVQVDAVLAGVSVGVGCELSHQDAADALCIVARVCGPVGWHGVENSVGCKELQGGEIREAVAPIAVGVAEGENVVCINGVVGIDNVGVWMYGAVELEIRIGGEAAATDRGDLGVDAVDNVEGGGALGAVLGETRGCVGFGAAVGGIVEARRGQRSGSVAEYRVGAGLQGTSGKGHQ